MLVGTFYFSPMEQFYQRFLSSTGISTDTRKIERRQFFVCLKGENFDGNTFAKQALEAGASTVIVDDATQADGENILHVEDSLQFLQDLALHHRRQFSIPVIGITGSNGKTTSKELIACVLQQKFKVLFTQGNLNNHIGVPLTVLQMNDSHEIAIIEMGANKFNDIEELSAIAEPTHGIITNIGAAHLEGFGSLEGVLKTKKELYDFVEGTGGTLFVNADDPTLTQIAPSSVTHITYGVENGSLKGRLHRLTPFVEFSWQSGEYVSPEIKTQLVGKYNFMNFVAALCVGAHFNVPADKMNKALAEYKPTNNRSQVQKTERNTLIVDCYNANPTSMMSALESFAEIENDNKLVILGDMLELGQESENAHRKILDYCASKNISAIYVGKEFGKVISSQNHFEKAADLLENFDLGEISDKLILLKGSRGIRLEVLVERL